MDDNEKLECMPVTQVTSSFNSPLPYHRVEKALRLESFINHADCIFREESSDDSDAATSDDNLEISHMKDNKNSYKEEFSNKEWMEEKLKFYNLKSVGKERAWLQNVILSDSESSDGDITEADVKRMLRVHVQETKTMKNFIQDPLQYQDEYAYYASSLILEHDKYHDRQKKRSKNSILLNKKKKKKKTKLKPKAKPVPSSKKRLATLSSRAMEKKKKKLAEAKLLKQQQQHEKEMNYKRRKLWNIIVKKEIPKACRARTNTRGTSLQTLKKVAQACQRERRKEALRSQKIAKEVIPRARRMAREMLLYWRRFDKVEKEHRKKAEKEALEQRRQDEEMREMKRQQRKLNFLITQTELYAHFMGKKSKVDSSVENDILKKLDDNSDSSLQRSVSGGVLVNNAIDDYDAESMKNQALIRAQNAVLINKQKINKFHEGQKKPATQQKFDTNFSLAETNLENENLLPQPNIFEGKLKTYQLKGMNWLVSLYEKGINGILADEMGLGKTVQSIVFLAHLAETYDIWGPFLIVAPASTLHNWQQEFTKFLPRFKVLPYWGDPNDRKSLRKFWNQNNGTSSAILHSNEKEAPFHVLITSYQLVVQDVKYFQRIRWQYLVLDEAHAIKSASSIRWKILLGYNCRNRLLLTGTPIQNTMAELWALLHFIMPTLFDSHDEFNEWFSKDIENHASEKKPSLDQNQLSRLHMILKPFMLRRVKKDVENELSEKIEIKVMCEMSTRQKLFYQAVKNKILFEDLLQSANTNNETKSTSLLMNLVMQFRKVCNHPELFERKEPITGLLFKLPALVISKLFYRQSFLCDLPFDKVALFERYFQIWSSLYIQQSISSSSSSSSSSSCFNFIRFVDLSPQDASHIFKSLVARLRNILLILNTIEKTQSDSIWHCKKKNSNPKSKYLSRDDLLIYQEKPFHSSSLSSLRFCQPNNNFSQHTKVLIEEIKSCSETKLSTRLPTEKQTRHCVAVSYPKYLMTCYPKVMSPHCEVYCSDRSAAYNLNSAMTGSQELLDVLRNGVSDLTTQDRKALFFPPPLQGLNAIRPCNGWSRVKIPDRRTLLSDSGKLLVLDQLLTRMKSEGHRVLIYSQMTKMIDILEEFMNFRQHSYMRLDGSSKISDRRDMVADFQTKKKELHKTLTSKIRNDIFAFLLSTRAGGLGINLTAADTVIFYDSDWNPTVDQQAMDRAHRLGQTKQVTVYRLVTKGTIEEKILNRAREKSEIQNIVISGGQFNKDVLRPKEVVSILLDDAELEAKLKQRQVEKKLAEESGRRPGRKRKQPLQNNKDSDSSLKKIKSNASLTTDDSISVISESSVTGIDSNDENSMSSFDFGLTMNCDDSGDNSEARSSPTPSQMSTPNITGRKRGRGRGSGSAGRGKGKVKSGTLARAAASAAALAGAAAGSAAAYAAYGYSFQASGKTN